jgi:hypothetical protein
VALLADRNQFDRTDQAARIGASSAVSVSARSASPARSVFAQTPDFGYKSPSAYFCTKIEQNTPRIKQLGLTLKIISRTHCLFLSASRDQFRAKTAGELQLEIRLYRFFA